MPEYLVRQQFPRLDYHVVRLEAWQADRLRERGEWVYTSARQAWAVAGAMNARLVGVEARREARGVPGGA